MVHGGNLKYQLASTRGLFVAGYFEMPIDHPNQLMQRYSFIRKNNMAKAAIEGAIWDLYTKNNKSR